MQRATEQGRARKLEPLYFGPYEVLEMHGTNAAKLKLPDGCRLHPVFNLDLLRKYVATGYGFVWIGVLSTRCMISTSVRTRTQTSGRSERPTVGLRVKLSPTSTEVAAMQILYKIAQSNAGDSPASLFVLSSVWL